MDKTIHRIYFHIWLWGFFIPLALTMINYGFLRPTDVYKWTVWKLSGSYGLVSDMATVLLLSAIFHGIPAFSMAEFSYYLLNKSADRNERAFSCRVWEIVCMVGIPILSILIHHCVYLASPSRISGYIMFNLIPWVALLSLPYGYFMGWVLWEFRSLFKKT